MATAAIASSLDILLASSKNEYCIVSGGAPVLGLQQPIGRVGRNGGYS